ncbi:MAG: Asp-tRNA(Asn)/Glu-tRNA(Gln) amidotransferase subunit GatC [Spirochaetes bacterium]|nr:Asp-tRNA(Asn)/Glu-tRNA(Gln) amidotransferase subunit GatC [Spirochaetota bacterium]
MAIDRKTIERTAELANLHLTENEKIEYEKQLNDILNYVEKIREVDTSAVKATDYIEEIKNVFREDVILESINRDEIEKIAPEFRNGHITVPKIIE